MADHIIADLGIVYCGATPSTLYKQLKSSQIEYVANLMEAKVAIVGDLELFAEVNAAKADCPNLQAIVLVNGYEENKDLDYVHSYHNLIEKGKPLGMDKLLEKAIAKNKKVSAYPIHEYWIDIGRYETLESANNYFKK